ncbi:hypothetical protein HO173_005213 [Letharia columbiana]|uniref:Uncharacterized protein n=1 Tax=Letharia columbiana TaxID=112416 RepID=A0A8H6FY84_9LECA|nr:uncharacterized protein HO173_005213 [Letharia columbiana]KAF6236922.1 hypothetical protein HO173_005213 [Letharia columbiana]
MQVTLGSGIIGKSGLKVESMDVTKTAIMLADREAIFTDVINAADGLHSVVRSHILDGKKFFPQPSTGQSAIRFMLPEAVAQRDIILSTAVSDDVLMLSWKGNDKRVLVPVDYDNQFNVTCTYPSNVFNQQTFSNNSAAAISYGQKVSYDIILDICSDFDPIAKRLFSLADPDGFRVWQLKDMDDHSNWSLNHTTLPGALATLSCHSGFFRVLWRLNNDRNGFTLSTLLCYRLMCKEEILLAV